MIDAVEARDLAQRYIKTLEPEVGCDLALLDASTIERAVGWMFFYQASDFIRTGDYSLALAGNAPVIVNRESGELVVAGTERSPEYYLAQYESQFNADGESDINGSLAAVFDGCDRIVVTAGGPFNFRNRERNDVMADVRETKIVQSLRPHFRVDLNSKTTGWLCPADFHINFLSYRRLIKSVGFLLGGWIRSDTWAGHDYLLVDPARVEEWLITNGVKRFPREAKIEGES